MNYAALKYYCALLISSLAEAGADGAEGTSVKRLQCESVCGLSFFIAAFLL